MNAFPAPGTAAPGKRSKWLLGLASFLLVTALAAGAFYFWLHHARAVPELPLDGQDAEVALKVKEARAAVVQAPQSATDWGYLGRVLMSNEIYPDSALVCFLEAERLDPAEPRWPYFGATLLCRDNPREALPKLERTVALTKASAEASSAPRLLLAETLAVLERPQQAAACFKEILAVEANNARAHFGLGLLAYARGDWQVCRTHLEACLGSPESRKKASSHLATVCERLGDKEAADRYAKIAAAAPKDFDWRDPYILENLQLAVRKRDRYRAIERLEAQGQFGAATNILAFMLSVYPDEYRPHLMMGRIQGQMGQLANAEYHLRKACAMSPDVIQVHYLLSLVLFRKGEALLGKKNDDVLKADDVAKAKAAFAESAQEARHVLAIRPDYGYAHMALGLALKRLDQRAAALSAFRQAVHCNPEYSDNHLFLGEALMEEGDVSAARQQLEQARLLALPNDPRPKAALDKLTNYTPKSK